MQEAVQSKKDTTPSHPSGAGSRAGTSAGISSKPEPIDVVISQSTFKGRKSHTAVPSPEGPMLSFMERVAASNEKSQQTMESIGTSFNTIVTQLGALLHFQIQDAQGLVGTGSYQGNNAAGTAGTGGAKLPAKGQHDK
jgi:hypothetical protein